MAATAGIVAAAPEIVAETLRVSLCRPGGSRGSQSNGRYAALRPASPGHPDEGTAAESGCAGRGQEEDLGRPPEIDRANEPTEETNVRVLHAALSAHWQVPRG